MVSVNDAFVMSAWQESLDPGTKSGVRFLADPKGDFVRQLDLIFDASGLLGNERSKRFAAVIKDGKVSSIDVEEDPTKVTSTSADKILV